MENSSISTVPVSGHSNINYSANQEAKVKKPLRVNCTGWKSMDGYENYIFLVNDNIIEWEVLKRYSNCMELHEVLLLKNSNLPYFPPKLVKMFMDDNALKERKDGLELYFKRLPPNILESDLLSHFFGVNGTDRKTRPVLAHQQPLMSPKLLISIREVVQIFQMQVIHLSSSVIYITPLLEEAVMTFSTLEEMKSQLDKIFGSSERLTFLNQINEKRNIHIAQLWRVKENIQQWLNEPQIIELSIVSNLFQDLVIAICHVINWNQSVEGDTMLELDLGTNVMSKSKEFSEQAEHLMTLYVQATDVEKTKTAIDVLIKNIQSEILKAKQTKSIEALSKLESILDYVNSGVASCSVSFNPREVISDVECQIFTITDQIEKLDDDSDSDVVIKVKNLLDNLKKRSAFLRNTLEKENKPENKSLIQNIDELQSIMGELYFTFKEKIEGRDDLAQIFSNTMVTRISKQQEKEQDKLFDL